MGAHVITEQTSIPSSSVFHLVQSTVSKVLCGRVSGNRERAAQHRKQRHARTPRFHEDHTESAVPPTTTSHATAPATTLRVGKVATGFSPSPRATPHVYALGDIDVVPARDNPECARESLHLRC